MDGVSIAEDAKLGQGQGAHSEVLKLNIKESQDLSLVGSSDLDGDEVFKEAVETRSSTIDSEDSVIVDGGNAEIIKTLENGKENSNLVSEVVERGTGVPKAALNSEDSVGKAELQVHEEHPDEKQIATQKVARDEMNESIDCSNVLNGKGDSRENVDSAANGETENLDNANEVNENFVTSPQNFVVDLSGEASFVETLTSEDAKILDADMREGPILEISETPKADELRGETDSEKPNTKGYIHAMAENQVANEVEGGDIGSEKPDNGVLDHANLIGTLNHEGTDIADVDLLQEHTQETSSQEVAKGTKGSEAGARAEFESNGDPLHNAEQDVIVNESVGNLGSGCQQDVSENASANVQFELRKDRAGELGEKPFVSGAEAKDDKDIEVKEIDSASVKFQKVDSQDVDKEETKGIVAADTSVADHGKEISGLEHAAKVQEPVSQDISTNGEREIKPAAGMSSSSANSVSHPAGLGHTAPLLEPASQKFSGNKECLSRSAVDTQSTNNASATSARPAGLGGAAPLLEPASRTVQPPRVNGAISPAQNQLNDDSTNGEAEEYDETREKLQMIRVKFLRLAHRLGQTPHNVVVAQVLYRLGLAEQLRGRSGGRVAAFSFDRASAMAEQLEAAGQEPLDFTCTIMVLGKSGVGKSATINSIFDEAMVGTDAFQLGTKKVQDIVGTVQGIRVRVIDTPGLLPSWSDQPQNEKILRSVKSFIKNTPPDIVLYLDRLDMQSRDFGDMPLLQTITETFGASIWFNAIVVLTHAATAPPEGPNGTTTSYDMFVTQRSHAVQQAIRQAAGDMRLMNPVSLVENHSACRKNPAGQRVLPNGQIWKPHLLLLSFASKILAEANTLLQLQDGPPGRPFAPRTRSLPLPFLLSSLLQSRPEVKLQSEQFGDDDDIDDDDLDECSDSEDESEYDELPPFKPLTKAQLEKLTKVQRKAYYDELEYREKLFLKKQLKEEKKRRKMMKKMREAAKDLYGDYGENAEEEATGASSVPVPMPDLALPASFDSDNPTHRYRSLDSSNPWLVRAVLEPNGWDHDIGYDGINVERLFVVKDKVPISFSGHISKDKKDANLQMEIASSVKHGKGKATSLGFDMQSVGKDMAYTLRSETRFSNHRINKAAAGLSATLMGDVLTGGVKIEDKLVIGKRGELVFSGGAVYGRGDIAYGGSLEATLRDKDHPFGRFLSTFGLSVMDWHGDMAIGCNSQTQIPVGRHTNLIGRLNINNRGSGQVSVRINSSEQLQIVLIGLIPLVKKVVGYFQQVQHE